MKERLTSYNQLFYRGPDEMLQGHKLELDLELKL